MAGNLTVGALLAQGIHRLQEASGESAVMLDAEVLLAHAMAMSRAQIKSHPETMPSAARARRYAELIERRAGGEPVAYITGHREFWSLQLGVSSTVLVPRPETELLVERALVARPDRTGRIADLGTGSGAIALALASARPEWQITATDVSEEALATARTNAAALGLGQIEFVAGSWFEPLAGRRFDLVLSNPPYVAEGDPALLHTALKHEPRLALAAGVDGLACLRIIIQWAPRYLERHGWLLLEHGSVQAAAVARELVVRGFRYVRSHRDLAGHERMTEAQWA
ncbi:MAG: peptide chain release factor N(5)-glutamine methyltransferase [Steroidobacteraceae bacterium]